MRQPPMLRVVGALVPIAISGVYFFGWRVVGVLAVCTAAGVLTEYVTTRRRGVPISMAVFVTSWLYALSLPPTVPMLVAVVGVVVAIVFGKEVFGGFGQNFANPAIVGRAFVYVCFPEPMTAAFVPAFKGFPGGFAHWSLARLGQLPEYLASTGKSVGQAVTQATPLFAAKTLGPSVVEQRPFSLWDLLFGSIGGSFRDATGTHILAAGSMGEGCALLIILAGAYLLVTRTANWRLMLSALAGVVLTSVIFRHGLGFDQWRPGAPDAPPVLLTLLGGTTLYAIVFMVTDPVSAPKRRPAVYAYGALIGFFMVLIRWRGVFVAAASFAILLGNLIGPLLDMAAAAWADRGKAAARAGQGAGP